MGLLYIVKSQILQADSIFISCKGCMISCMQIPCLLKSSESLQFFTQILQSIPQHNIILKLSFCRYPSWRFWYYVVFSCLWIVDHINMYNLVPCIVFGFFFIFNIIIVNIISGSLALVVEMNLFNTTHYHIFHSSIVNENMITYGLVWRA